MMRHSACGKIAATLLTAGGTCTHRNNPRCGASLHCRGETITCGHLAAHWEAQATLLGRVQQMCEHSTIQDGAQRRCVLCSNWQHVRAQGAGASLPIKVAACSLSCNYTTQTTTTAAKHTATHRRRRAAQARAARPDAYARPPSTTSASVGSSTTVRPPQHINAGGALIITTIIIINQQGRQ